MQNAPSSDSSITFIPFYDTILPQNKRSMLAKVKMCNIIEPKVEKILQATMNRNEVEKANAQRKEQNEQMLLKFRP